MKRNSFNLDRFKNSNFLGEQLSRLKMGQSYYAILMSTINAISLISLAYQIELMWLVIIFPVLLAGTLWIGYYLDRHNINTMDTLKSNEMANRFLNLGDIKAQEFQMLQTDILIQALTALQENRKIDPKLITQKYEQYLRRWQSPYESNPKITENQDTQSK